MFQKLLVGAVAALSIACAGAAHAAYVFVGSWQVDQGPAWDSAGPDGPLAYTAQEAAALLFGGDPGDYVTSISGTHVIDFQAWYALVGTDSVGIFDQDFSAKHLGQFYGPVASHDDDSVLIASAYVNDRVLGDRFKNYAFREDTSTAPEPATWALLIGGFGLAGTALRRRRAVAGPSRG